MEPRNQARMFHFRDKQAIEVELTAMISNARPGLGIYSGIVPLWIPKLVHVGWI